jgi:hypothetical protein
MTCLSTQCLSFLIIIIINHFPNSWQFVPPNEQKAKDKVTDH